MLANVIIILLFSVLNSGTAEKAHRCEVNCRAISILILEDIFFYFRLFVRSFEASTK